MTESNNSSGPGKGFNETPHYKQSVGDTGGAEKQSVLSCVGSPKKHKTA